MRILVLNCGSSSIKYQLFEMSDKSVLAKGVVDKIGLKGSLLKHIKANGDKVRLEGEILDHQSGIEYVLGVLTSDNHGCLNSLEDIDAVGHRVVHGGEYFTAINHPAIIDPLGAGAQGGGVGAGLWLGDGKGADHIPFKCRHEIFLFLLFRAFGKQHMRCR